jgi:geranylgeranyl diphosphate synthase type I
MTATLTTHELARDLVEPELRAVLGRLDPQIRHVCGYAIGLWDQAGTSQAAPGKGVRATLALLAAQATGRSPAAGLPAAVAVELLHNYSLVHDDVMDGDRLRRHRPTVWAAFGQAQAILAGDAMLGLAAEVLAETGSAWAVQCLMSTSRRLICGQGADLAFEHQRSVTLPACIRMAQDKTGALLACSASLGVVVAGGSVPLACQLATFGMHLGLAFQLTDDLLGIWGDPEVTGKPVLSDLRVHKKTLPVVAALCSPTPAGRRLRDAYLAQRMFTESELADIAALVDAAGGRAWAEEMALAELAAALAVLDSLELGGAVLADLRDLAVQLARRER